MWKSVEATDGVIFLQRRFICLQAGSWDGADHFNPINNRDDSVLVLVFVRPDLFCWPLFLVFVVQHSQLKSQGVSWPQTSPCAFLLLWHSKDLCLFAQQRHFVLGFSASCFMQLSYRQIFQMQMPVWIPGSLFCFLFLPDPGTTSLLLCSPSTTGFMFPLLCGTAENSDWVVPVSAMSLTSYQMLQGRRAKNVGLFLKHGSPLQNLGSSSPGCPGCFLMPLNISFSILLCFSELSV